MKTLIRQVAGFCRDHPVCWTPLLIGAAIAVALNGVSKYRRHLIIEWASGRQSVLGGRISIPLSNPVTEQRALFASTIVATVINLMLVLAMTFVFVAMARLAEKVLAGEVPSTAEILRALMIQFRGIAWFSLQYSVCLFAVTLIGSLVFLSPDFKRLFAMTFLNTTPAISALALVEVMALAYMLAVPAMRLVSPSQITTGFAKLESKARELGLWFAFGNAALGWCWDLVRFNVRFDPAISKTAAEFAANVAGNIPLLMLAVAFVMITAPDPATEEPEVSALA